MKQRKAHRLLDRRVTVQLDVGARPEVCEERLLFSGQPVEARAERRGQGSVDLGAQGAR